MSAPGEREPNSPDQNEGGQIEGDQGQREQKPARDIRIALLTELDQFQRCVDLQLEIWGYGGGDLIPRRMFLLAHRIGGMVLGAFDGEVMIGFAMALPGVRGGRPYLHSHMLAVLAGYRDGGVGRRMKLAQRDAALERGFELMEWTFDPLEIKNAYLNIAKLGAIVRRYEPDFYGPSSSPLQGGLPTDRLYAEWWLRSERVEAALRGEFWAGSEDMQTIAVPAAVYAWKQDEERRHLALELQSRNRELLEAAFRSGQAVVGFRVDAERNGSFVLGDFR